MTKRRTRGRGAANPANSVSSESGLGSKFLLLSASALGALAGAAQAQDLPQGGVVVAGGATINSDANVLTVDQDSQNAIINWNSFDIGAGHSVYFNQPGVSAATLNRVLGDNPSILSGSLFAPGTVFLINHNGIALTSSGRIDAGAFAASTLNMTDEDFLAGDYTFSGQGGVVTNRGYINANNVALIGGAVRNEGVVIAQLGQVAYGAGDLVTIDFGGDSLISIGLPVSELNNSTDVFGTPLDALISIGGVTRADGGRVHIRAGAAEQLALAAVRVGGDVRAASVSQNADGSITLGGEIEIDGGAGGVSITGTLDASSVNGEGGRVQVAGGYVGFGGTIDVSGGAGGVVDIDAGVDLSLAGAVDASGTQGGGSVRYQAGRSVIENAYSSTDVSGGGGSGGAVRLLAGASIASSGAYDASGALGGRIDVSASDITLLSAVFNASGVGDGGLVRVGGAFQGGADARLGRADYAAFEGRFGALPALASATSTFINDGTLIDVSSAAGRGGGAIVWSGDTTTMLGQVNASGLVGGNVEISSAGRLRQTDLLGINVGRGGTLLLDPAHIIIGDYAAASDWTYSAIIGVGAVGGGGVTAYDPPGVSPSELFGYSVSLNAAGDRMAVGGPDDAGFNDNIAGAGAVRLFTFTDDNFGGAALSGTIGADYVGVGNLDITALTTFDQFGTSVALNAAGDRLAVGAVGDDGFGDAVNNAGAVYLVSFADGDFGGASLTGTMGAGYVGAGDVNVATLEIDDGFGRSVALNGAGDRLAVGIRGDDGFGNAGSNTGAVQLYTFTDASFGGGALAATIGLGYLGANDVNLTLDSSDFLGVAVSLNAAGDRLAVGALGDDGAGNAIENTGSVRLFTFTDTSFGGASLSGTIGYGYAGAGDIDVSDLQSDDEFGSAVALNALGDRIAIGARGDDGATNAVADAGAVRLYRFADTAFGGGALELTIGHDYAGADDIDMSVLPAGVRFGHAVSLNGDGDLLAVGAEMEDLADAVWLFTSTPSALSSQLFADDPSGTSLISRTALAATLATGANIVLQANSDITLEGDLLVDAAGAGGDLNLAAGRSILLGDNAIDTDGGDLTLLANASTADGVVDAFREAGAAEISMGAGGSIDAGAGAVNVTLGAGAGLTNSDSGDITLASVDAASISVRNSGTSAGSDVVIHSGAALTSTDAGLAISIAADNGTYTSAGSLNPTGGGYYAVWADSPLLATENETGFLKRYNIANFGDFATLASGAGGNVFAFRLAPVLTITADGQTRIYGEADPALTFSVGGLIDGDTEGDALLGALTRAAGEDVGLHAILQGTLAATALGYTINYTGANLEITPRPITVTADGLSRIYGEADPALTYTIGGMGLALGDTFTGGLSRDAGENVGVYNINQGTLALSSNYTLTYVGDTLEITPRAVTVTADDLARIYGEADPALTYTIGGMGLVFGDAFSGALSRDAGENVGVYNINQGTLALSSNYDLTYVGGDFEITPRAVTVTADDLARIYGEADPTLTYTIGGMGLVFGDAFTGGLTRDAGENVGVYSINQGTLALGANYAITYVGGAFEITPRPITVTADDLARIYGEADPALTYAVGGMGLVFGDTLTGALSRDAGENVGLYAINQGSLALSANYALTYVGGTFEITPRPITVTADDLTRIYGEADPALTYTIGGMGLVFGDAFTGGLSRDAGENVGVYSINQGALALSANYAITFVNGQFEITPRAITVTADDLARIYGEADPALTYTVGGMGLVFGDTLTGALARDAGENVGFYAINQGTLGLSSNYDITYVGGQFEITPRAVTVTADDLARIYGEADPTLTYTIGGMGLVFGDAASGALSRDAGENVGVYSINQGTLALGSNYDITYVGGAFEITPRPITVTADDLARIYGEADPTLTYTIGGMGLALGDTFTGGLSRDAGENVGRYAINQGTLALNANYTLSYVGGAFEITPRPITVTANDLTRIYGDADPALTYTIGGMGLVFGDTPTGALTRNAGENVGAYAVNQGTLALSGNYALSYVGGTLTITPRPITVSADDIFRLFNAADPPLTWSITQGNLVFGDALSGSLARTPGELPGLYAILLGTLSHPNYAIAYQPGVFTIQGEASNLTSARIAAPGPEARPPAWGQTALEVAPGDNCPENDGGVCVTP